MKSSPSQEFLCQLQESKGKVMKKTPIPLGKYRHFKGNEYEVIGIAKHSETLEELVVYQALYGEKELWIRPLSMWTETVVHCGKQQPRFTYLGENI